MTKVSSLTPGWHEDSSGRWYQNADGTYYTNGFAEIDGVKYAFDSNGYMQTGWVTKGVNDYYFNEDGSYNAEKKRPLIALTFDDGPGQYTDKLLDCLEENNAHATFFMLGQLVGQYPDEVKRMVEPVSYTHLDVYKRQDYDGAISLLQKDNAYVRNVHFQNAAEKFQKKKDKCVAWSPEQVTHIFYHSLIVDTSKAFDGDYKTDGYNQVMTTMDAVSYTHLDVYKRQA